jgi:hypothetical protein
MFEEFPGGSNESHCSKWSPKIHVCIRGHCRLDLFQWVSHVVGIFAVNRVQVEKETKIKLVPDPFMTTQVGG